MDAGIHSAIRGTSRIRALFANRREVGVAEAERAEDPLRAARGSWQSRSGQLSQHQFNISGNCSVTGGT